MNAFYELLLKFYKSGAIDLKNLDKAVSLGYITNEEKLKIVGVSTLDKVEENI